MDFVCSLPADDRRIRRIDRMSWMAAEALSEAWHAVIAKNGQKSRNLIVGTRRIMEFDGGAYIAELLTPEALRAQLREEKTATREHPRIGARDF